MLKNYLKIAFRNLRKNPGYSMINIAGLAAGLACFILIVLFVFYEFSYDRFYDNADSIFRVVQRQPGNVFLDTDYYAVTPAPLAQALTSNYPGVTDATTLQEQSALLGRDDERFQETGYWADERFFDVFPTRFIEGNPDEALTNPGSIVLTTSLAQKLFGDQDPIGQTLQYQDQETYAVTGIIPDIPSNSSLQYTFITSIHSQPEYEQNLSENNWTNNWWYTFFVTNNSIDEAQFQSTLQNLVTTNLYGGNGSVSDEGRTRFLIQPLTDIHFGQNYNRDLGSKGNIVYVYLFLAVAFTVLLLACFNYVNLATARSVSRTREVGMRMVVGARRRQLIGQFLGESILLTFIALMFSLVLVDLLLPVFSYMVERPLQVNYLDGSFLAGLMALVIFIGLVCGSYPAFFLTSNRPQQVLQGTTVGGTSPSGVRNSLIIGQYAISIVLIAGSLLVYRQMQYINTKDPGYNRDNVVAVTVNDQNLQRRYETIKEELLRNPNIEAVTFSYHLPTDINSRAQINDWEGNDTDNGLQVHINSFGYDFEEVFGIDLVAGRTFTREGDTSGGLTTLINETAARSFGWTPRDAIGKHFTTMGMQFTVIGVLNDFNMQSMHMLIEPLIVLSDPNFMGYISARVSPENLPGTIASMEQTTELFSSFPFDYQFLDDTFNQIYQDDRRLGKTLGVFTILSLFIASLGLFGLVAYVSEQRKKEIGIRKVLGATIGNIIGLLSRDFVKRIVIGFVIAVPIAWYAMSRWLESFAYRIEIEPGIFLLAGGVAFFIALLTISWETIRAALTNPVNSLRSE